MESIFSNKLTSKPQARLCVLRKWSGFQGYGFSLLAVRRKIGHKISELQPDSPAEAAGLRDKDFVIEVNGFNVVTEQHSTVVRLIREHPDHVNLLVTDRDTFKNLMGDLCKIDSGVFDMVTIECPSDKSGSNEELNATNSDKMKQNGCPLPTEEEHGSVQSSKPTLSHESSPSPSAPTTDDATVDNVGQPASVGQQFKTDQPTPLDLETEQASDSFEPSWCSNVNSAVNTPAPDSRPSGSGSDSPLCAETPDLDVVENALEAFLIDKDAPKRKQVESNTNTFDEKVEIFNQL